mmetsp:Transcript_99477/g.297198  ORF Transcript_99477/g.297198 Transcript_99477/m.297198 type:complete len:624 (-) Transcript_99477:665-2536(-)
MRLRIICRGQQRRRPAGGCWAPGDPPQLPRCPQPRCANHSRGTRHSLHTLTDRGAGGKAECGTWCGIRHRRAGVGMHVPPQPQGGRAPNTSGRQPQPLPAYGAAPGGLREASSRPFLAKNSLLAAALPRGAAPCMLAGASRLSKPGTSPAALPPLNVSPSSNSALAPLWVPQPTVPARRQSASRRPEVCIGPGVHHLRVVALVALSVATAIAHGHCVVLHWFPIVARSHLTPAWHSPCRRSHHAGLHKFRMRGEAHRGRFGWVDRGRGCREFKGLHAHLQLRRLGASHGLGGCERGDELRGLRAQVVLPPGIGNDTSIAVGLLARGRAPRADGAARAGARLHAAAHVLAVAAAARARQRHGCPEGHGSPRMAGWQGVRDRYPLVQVHHPGPRRPDLPHGPAFGGEEDARAARAVDLLAAGEPRRAPAGFRVCEGVEVVAPVVVCLPALHLRITYAQNLAGEELGEDFAGGGTVESGGEPRGGRGVTEIDEGIAQAVSLVAPVHGHVHEVVLALEAVVVELLQEHQPRAAAGDVPQHHRGQGLPVTTWPCACEQVVGVGAARRLLVSQKSLKHELGLEDAGRDGGCALVDRGRADEVAPLHMPCRLRGLRRERPRRDPQRRRPD